MFNSRFGRYTLGLCAAAAAFAFASHQYNTQCLLSSKRISISRRRVYFCANNHFSPMPSKKRRI